MKTLILEETLNSPFVKCDECGKIVIEGKKLPESLKDFFAPVVHWMGNNNGKSLNLHIKLKSMSAKQCNQLLHLLQSMMKHTERSVVDLNWYYLKNDEDVLEIGKSYSLALGKSFNFVEYAEDKPLLMN